MRRSRRCFLSMLVLSLPGLKSVSADLIVLRLILYSQDDCASFYPSRNQGLYHLQGVNGILPTKQGTSTPISVWHSAEKQARPLCYLRRLQSQHPQNDTHPSHGMGSPQHPRQQRVPRPRQHSHDLLGAAAGGLGAAAEVLCGFPRLAELQELGGPYVYLLSDTASYTTSIDIPMNGVIGSGYLFSLWLELGSLTEFGLLGTLNVNDI